MWVTTYIDHRHKFDEGLVDFNESDERQATIIIIMMVRLFF